MKSDLAWQKRKKPSTMRDSGVTSAAPARAVPKSWSHVHVSRPSTDRMCLNASDSSRLAAGLFSAMLRRNTSGSFAGDVAIR